MWQTLIGSCLVCDVDEEAQNRLHRAASPFIPHVLAIWLPGNRTCVRASDLLSLLINPIDRPSHTAATRASGSGVMGSDGNSKWCCESCGTSRVQSGLLLRQNVWSIADLDEAQPQNRAQCLEVGVKAAVRPESGFQAARFWSRHLGSY